MNCNEAYRLFERMIDVALREIDDYIRKNKLGVSIKDDGTLVTGVDKHLDRVLGNFAMDSGLNVISEEQEDTPRQIEILRGGNYMTIDPVDGSGPLKNHVGSAKKKNFNSLYVDPELGKDPRRDYCLLLGIVEDFIPRFACCYNFVTQDKILLDSESAAHMIRTPHEKFRFKRDYSGRYVQYIEIRTKDKINAKIEKDPEVKTFVTGSYGLRAVLVQIENHEAATAIHNEQQSGLWDILPGLVVAQCTKARILDGFGHPIDLRKYPILLEKPGYVPGMGINTIIGEKFSWVEERIKTVFAPLLSQKDN